MAKSKYFTHVEPKLTLVEGWARDGLTDEQIAKNLGISKDSFYKYKKQYSDFSDSLKKGKEIIDYEVENALLKRALGYEYDEVTFEHGEETKRVTKQVAPDTTAQIFWLKNRKPDKWRDKQVVESNNTIEVKNPYEGLSTEELKKLIRDG
ncbi:transposase [Paraclostridium bifermentans]|uniref:transposase n=1 Tax=Paraclostridium bifermentans TaxID=1490 RepID=UPI002431536C|nr:transposase [Paraclostridium bifermentans]